MKDSLFRECEKYFSQSSVINLNIQYLLLSIYEGGYDLEGLGTSVADSFRALLGEPSFDKFDPVFLRDEPEEKVRRLILDTKNMHNL